MAKPYHIAKQRFEAAITGGIKHIGNCCQHLSDYSGTYYDLPEPPAALCRDKVD